jgi:hypothetical protein
MGMYVKFYVPQKYEADKIVVSGTDLAQGRRGRDNAHRLLEGNLKVRDHFVDVEVGEKYQCES